LVKQIEAAEYDYGDYNCDQERERCTALRLTGGMVAIISFLGHDASYHLIGE
jgi:hypothetical protein